MTQAFPDFPELSALKSQHPFSLPQQDYLLSKFLLEQCKNEAQRWFEGDYPAEELERMNSLEKWERLEDYHEQLGYDKALETSIKARKHLIEWGFEHLHKGPQTPPDVEILAKRNLIYKRPHLQDEFVEICMTMTPKRPEKEKERKYAHESTNSRIPRSATSDSANSSFKKCSDE